MPYYEEEGEINAGCLGIFVLIVVLVVLFYGEPDLFQTLTYQFCR